MVTNFDFLRKTDKNLYEIISDAELLYRDEYYDQCISQTRKFAENVCKNTLGSLRTNEDTFDQMLATLKDNSNGSAEEKEFIDDLYFLKKCGNESVHSSKVSKSGITALECLQRAFEIAINYSVYIKEAPKENFDLHFDIDLLATGKKNKKLAKEYQKARGKYSKEVDMDANENVKRSKQSKTKTKKPQQSEMKSYPKPPKISPYWYVVGFFSIIALFLMLFLLIVK